MIDEWDERQVCPDGACIGVIGKDGRCSVCGRASNGEGGAYREIPAATGDEEAASAPAVREPADVVVENGDWSGRKLCSDGACTGVLGADGRCKVCGKAAA